VVYVAWLMYCRSRDLLSQCSMAWLSLHLTSDVSSKDYNRATNGPFKTNIGSTIGFEV
jgi:hypothetical protein